MRDTKMMHRALLSALLASCTLSCKDAARDGKASDDAKVEPSASVAPTVEPTEPIPATSAEKLLEWLDPEAVTVIYSKLPAQIDTNALAVIFALPPKIARMLRTNANVVEALDAVLPPDAPRPDVWLGPESLQMTPVVASGTYVLRPLAKPRDEVQALLESAGMQASVVEGITLLVPQGAFPWKAAFVSDEVIAFIPAKEIGSGLSPLTAGRDMPPSDASAALREVIRNEPDALLELYAAGPIVHFDVGRDILQLAVRARRWESHGLDVEVRMLPSDDPQAAADKLEARTTPLETDKIQALVDRVAYSLDAGTVVGRLQLDPEDVATLAEAS